MLPMAVVGERWSQPWPQQEVAGLGLPRWSNLDDQAVFLLEDTYQNDSESLHTRSSKAKNPDCRHAKLNRGDVLKSKLVGLSLSLPGLKLLMCSFC